MLQRLATLEAATVSVSISALIHRRSLAQAITVSDADRLKSADWAFTFRSYSSAISVRMVKLMEHALAELNPFHRPVDQVDRQVNVQLYYVLLIVSDRAMKKPRNRPCGHGCEFWKLQCAEDELECDLAGAVERATFRSVGELRPGGQNL